MSDEILRDNKKAKILDDDVLSSVSGGYHFTYMSCSHCGYGVTWETDKYVGNKYDCPKCSWHTLLGVYGTDVNPYKH